MNPTQRLTVAVLAACLPMASTGSAAAQTIELEHVVTLGVDEEIGYVAFPLQVLEHGDEFYVVVEVDATRVRVYSADGEFQRMIGRAGQGPGEFQNIVGIGIHEDVLSVVDRGLRRVTHIPLPSGAVETAPLPVRFYGPQAALVLNDGRFLVNGEAATFTNRVLHVFEGNVRTSSFSAATRDQTFNVRATVQDGDGLIWSAPYRSADITVWDPDGTRVRDLNLPRDWFDDGLVRDRRGPWYEVGPVPAQMDLAIHGAVVWRLGRIPANDWEAALETDENGVPFDFDSSRYYGSIVQVADRSTSRLLAERVLQPEELTGSESGWAVRFVDGVDQPLLVVYRADPEPVLEIWRLALAPPQP